MTTRRSVSRPRRLGFVVFFVAAGVLAFELSLMRVLLVASWHHFAFLVISIALLGFGASGTALSLLRTRLLPRGEGVLFALVLVSSVSMPLCVAVAQHIPIEARFTPALLGRQLALWAAYWAVLGVPFFTGAGAIGLALMLAGRTVPRIYAANLIGSAVGLAFATAVMYLVPPAWLSWCAGGLALLGAVGLQPGSLRIRVVSWVLCAGTAAGVLVVDLPYIRIDPYKRGAYVKRLGRQGEAHRTAVAYGPRALVEAYRSELFHDLPFLSVGATPPPISILLADGHAAGSVLDVADPREAQVVEHTLMAFPYAFLPAHPRVLLLGEGGGANVWLAARHRAAAIHVVQPDANILALLRGPLRPYGGAVLDLPAVTVLAAQPRHVIEHAPERYDLIQLAALESSAAGSGGVGGLAENHLVTVEGFTAALRRLTDDGLLVTTRGIQTPPRDNFKLFATFAAALRRVGVAEPGRHLVVVRDYLAVCTLAKATPFTAPEIELVRRVCTDRELTPVWFSGIRPDELNQPDQLESPPSEEGDWYHYAAARLFSDSPGKLIRDWPFDIRPPNDDRPFFFDFCKLGSVGELKRAFGDLWLTRTELAFLFVLAAMVLVGGVSAVLTVLPLLVFQGVRRAHGWMPTLWYFGAIGLAYLLLEMTFLSRTTRWIGDPVSAAAVTIAGFLLFSGLGSLTLQRRQGRLDREAHADRVLEAADGPAGNARTGARSRTEPPRLIRRVLVGLIVVGVIELIVAGPLAKAVGALPFSVRCAAALLAIAPLGYLMGFPMPAALARLERGAPALIPWAWGVNGFASVLAAPAAMAIGMTWGYATAGVIALLLYLVPLVVFTRLAGEEQ